MLACHYNVETTALEIVTWTPGAWELPVEPCATRLEGSGWSLGFPNSAEYLARLGLVETDAIRLYEIDLAHAIDVPEPIDLRWEPDAARAYEILRASFADRWDIEGIAPEAWAELWLGRDIDRKISGIGYAEGEPVGLILAEEIDYPIGIAVAPQRFYRTVAILPDFQGRGLGLRLYRTSLARAKAAGVASARWVCFASNGPIARLMDRLGARVVESQPFYQGRLPLRGGAAGEIPG